MHLMVQQGETWREIERDGFAVAEKVDMQIGGDSPAEIARAIGAGISGMAAALDRLRPDIMVLLGDRFETLAAAIAAMIARVPIAHIHGGEATEGLIDEPIRHSVTKMAQLHFTATEEYRRRVIQLGEDPARVHCVGAPGLDNIRAMDLLDRDALQEALGFRLQQPTFLVTYHPVTLEAGSAADHAEALLGALDSFPNACVVITLPNADTESAALRARMNSYAERNRGRAAAFAVLGTQRYLSLLALCDVVIGNSSSGLIEAPSFRVPTVDIGDRQRGRIAPRSVIRCAADCAAIRAAIAKALNPAFRMGLKDLVNPYGDGRSAPRIVAVLKSAPLGADLIKKRFFDLRHVAA
jgi:UDP-hydrolysing UDP-N-acetyl-D-glucosamine 2-epimerase